MKRPDGMYDPEVELELYEEYADYLEKLIWKWIDWKDSIYDHDGENPCKLIPYIERAKKIECHCFMCQSSELVG